MPPLRAARHFGPIAMEIRFCDICNESVPEADLVRGRAVLRAGRVVCAQCEAAMGGAAGFSLARAGSALPGSGSLGAGVALMGAAPAGSFAGPTLTAVAPSTAAPASAPGAHVPRRRADLGGAATAIGLVALGVGGAGTWLAVERLGLLERRHAADLQELAADLDAARRARAQGAAELATQLGEVEASARGAVEAVATESEGRVRELAEALAAAEAREVDLRRELEAARLRTEEVLTLVRRERETDAARLAAAEVDVRATRDRLIAVEENLRTVGAGTPPAAAVGAGAVAPTGAAPATSPAAPAPPSWERHLGDLSSKDEGLRVDAVIALGDTRDPAAAPHVLPMLKDPNLWVRMVAAEALGKLGDPQAVPALIDALEDERTAVREQALFALQALTRETLRFDANASEAERAKRVREWRDWWAKNRERLLGS